MVANSERFILVFDIGGSHVSAAVCATGGFQLGSVVTALHQGEMSSAAFLDQIERLGKEAAKGTAHPEGAALAFPGPFDYTAGVSLMRHKMPDLYGVDLRTALAARFGWNPCQVTFVNDASAFLLGEISAGAAKGFSRSVGLTLGTGVGSAFAVNGCLVNEGKGVPPGGEIWNLPFDGATIEDAVSARAIRRAYSRRTGREQEVVLLARRSPDDPDARVAFHKFGESLGLALRATLAGFDPQVVVLGGGICRSAELFLPSAQLVVEDLHLDIRISQLFERAALVGAAAAWLNSSNGAYGNLLR
jgi:glucokinase